MYADTAGDSGVVMISAYVIYPFADETNNRTAVFSVAVTIDLLDESLS